MPTTRRTLEMKLFCLLLQCGVDRLRLFFFSIKMDFVDTVVLSTLVSRALAKRRKRKYWVHPIYSERLINGKFYTLYSKLRQHHRNFFKYFRMNVSTFDKLLKLMGPYITYQDTNFRKAIPAPERLAVTLRYLAAQQSFYDLSLDYLIAPSTLRSIIKVTCDKIWCVLQPLYMAEKTNEDWIKIAKQFHIRAGFPNVIGAIDGKHIRIEKPNNAGSEDFNYKKYFSVVLMAWVDADYKFVFVDIGSYGSSSDATIFKSSNMGKRLEQGTLNIPSGNNLPGDESGRILPYYVIGDEAFGLTKNILRPYAKRDLNTVKKVFNYRLTRARRFVECTFGILANKWRILHRPLDVNRDFCDNIIKACCILHNYVRVHDGIEFTDTIYDCPLADYNSNNSAMSSGNDIRQYLCSYFVSPEGSLPWQYEKI